MRGLTLPFVFVLVIACGGQSAPPSPSPDASPTQPPASDAPSTATPRATQGQVTVLPGEPWIVYQWGVPAANSVGNIVIRPDGTDEHWATPDAPISTEGWQLHPDWSPDGEHLAFVVDDVPDGKRDIWVSDADGSNSRKVFDCIFPCDAAEFPAWSMDGESVLFVTWDHADRISDGSLLRQVDVATGEVTTLAATTGPNYFAYPRWSPDGTRVVAQVDTWSNITEDSVLEHTTVAIVDLGASPATVMEITPPDEWANSPDWHSTDDLIVYSRRPADDLEGSDYDLYTMRTDGTAPTLLVARDLDDGESLNATQPTWFPDGSGIIFVRVTGEDYTTAGMWAVNADGSDVRPFPEGLHGGSHPRLRPLP